MIIPGRGAAAGLYAALTIFLLNNLAALGYFLPVIGALYAPSTYTAQRVRGGISAWMVVPLAILGALVLALGLHPGPWLDWLEHVGTFLLGTYRG